MIKYRQNLRKKKREEQHAPTESKKCHTEPNIPNTWPDGSIISSFKQILSMESLNDDDDVAVVIIIKITSVFFIIIISSYEQHVSSSSP